MGRCGSRTEGGVLLDHQGQGAAVPAVLTQQQRVHLPAGTETAQFLRVADGKKSSLWPQDQDYRQGSYYYSFSLLRDPQRERIGKNESHWLQIAIVE
jgi:hypothetical protein